MTSSSTWATWSVSCPSPKSSITSNDGFCRLCRNFAKDPSRTAVDICSYKSLARKNETVNPKRHACDPNAHASQVLPTPVDPRIITLSCFRIHSQVASDTILCFSRPRSERYSMSSRFALSGNPASFTKRVSFLDSRSFTSQGSRSYPSDINPPPHRRRSLAQPPTLARQPETHPRSQPAIAWS